MDFLRSRLGTAIVAALAVMLGVFLSDLVGWSEADGWDYALGAIGGFLGGLIAWQLQQRRRK